jgi:hypothetical protein
MQYPKIAASTDHVKYSICGQLTRAVRARINLRWMNFASAGCTAGSGNEWNRMRARVSVGSTTLKVGRTWTMDRGIVHAIAFICLDGIVRTLPYGRSGTVLNDRGVVRTSFVLAI